MFNITGFATLFDVVIKDNCVRATLSTGKKMTRDGVEFWNNSSWFNVTFLGKDNVDRARELEEKDRIVVKRGEISKSKYTDSNGDEQWGINVIIWDFMTMSEYQDIRNAEGQEPPTKPTEKVKDAPIPTENDEDLPF